jgi:hypothetical protein
MSLLIRAVDDLDAHMSLHGCTACQLEPLLLLLLEHLGRSGCLADFVDVLPRLGEAAPAGAGATRR